MTFAAILLLAVGLAMDATAAAAAQGLAAERIRARHVALVAACFGGSQALMPLLGWLLGSRIGPAVQAWDHWLAFGLLGALGAKMLWEARDPPDGATAPTRDPFAVRTVLALSFATSVDAFAAGVTLPVLDAPLALSVVTIGVTTAALSAAGLFAGRRFGARLGKRLDAVGGLVLVALGTKILVEHLWLS